MGQEETEILEKTVDLVGRLAEAVNEQQERMNSITALLLSYCDEMSLILEEQRNSFENQLEALNVQD